MSFLTDYNLITNAEFIGRLTMAILRAARNVSNESAQTANHTNRIAWAASLVDRASAEAEAHRMAVSVAANGTISAAFATNSAQSAIPDSDLEFVVNGLVDTYANAAAL